MALMIPAAMMLTGCVGFFNRFSYTYDNGEKYTAGDRDIEDKVTSINLDYIMGDVKIKAADTDKISVKETANISLKDPQKVHTWVNEGTLYIRFCASLKIADFHGIEKSLEVTIPEDLDLNDTVIKMSSGDLDASGLKSGKLKAHSSSGNVGIDCESKDIELKASSGKIILSQKGDSDSIVLKASSGSITLTQTGSSGSIDIHSSSGDVTADVDMVSKLAIAVSSGNITVGANEITELNSKASSGHNEFKFNVVPKTSTIKSSSGYVKVFMPEDSDVTVHTKISSGEFNSEVAFAKNGKDYTFGSGSSTMDINVSSGNVNICRK